MTALEADRRRDGRADHIDELARRLDRSARASPHDGARDRACVALLAVLAQERCQAPLLPALDDLACSERLRRVHAHVQRRLVGVGEPALARIQLHRRHPEIEVREPRAQPFAGQQFEGFGVAGADEAHRAGSVAREGFEPLLGERVAVDCDQRPRCAEALGQQAGVAAVAEGAVHGHRSLQLDARAHDHVEQLVGEHRNVPGVAGSPACLGLVGAETRACQDREARARAKTGHLKRQRHSQ